MMNGRLGRIVICFLILMLMGFVGAASAEVIEIEDMGVRLTIEDRYFQLGLRYYTGSAFETDYYACDNKYVAFYCIDPAVESQVAELRRNAKKSGDQAGMEAAANLQHEHWNNIISLVMMDKATYEKKTASGEDMVYDLSAARELGEHNGRLYWVIDKTADDDDSKEAQSEAEIAAFEECAAMLSDLDGVLEYIPVPETDYGEFALGKRVPSFETTDQTRARVTNDIFAQKDLTLVLFWYIDDTWFIDEMLPHLVEWSRELPDNVQILSVIEGMGFTDYEKANKILDKANVDFTCLNGSYGPYRGKGLICDPTAVLVDHEGVVVHNPIGMFGKTAVDTYRAAVEAYLNGQ